MLLLASTAAWGPAGAAELTDATADVATVVSGGWFSPDAARSESDLACANTLGGTLDLTGFSFALPGDAEIRGFTVNVYAITAASPAQSTVRLLQPAFGATDPPRTVAATSGGASVPCSNSNAASTGGPTDLWDVDEPWTVAQVVDPSFGVRVSGVGNDQGAYRLDFVSITVHYTVPVAAPTLLSATSQPNHVALSWTDNASDESGFEIDRAAAEAGPFVEIATREARSGTGVTFFDDVAAPCGQLWYRARATRADGDSGSSNVAAVTKLCADLEVAKVAEPAAVRAGDPWTWRLTVGNTGDGPAALAAASRLLVDPLPAGPVYGTPQVSTSGGVTGAVSCSIAAGTLSCTVTSPLIVPPLATVAVAVGATQAGTGDPAKGGATCLVDPDGAARESDEGDNACPSSSVAVRWELAVAPAGGGSGNGAAGPPASLACDWNGTLATGACTAALPDGASVAITASAALGSAFDGWAGCDTTSGAGGATCHLTMGGHRSVTPTFRAAGSYFALTPCRVLDTRLPLPGDALDGGETRVVAVRGVCGVPASARAVALNVTAAGATAPGYLRLFPDGGPLQAPGTVSFPAGVNRAAQTVLGLSTAGTLAVFAGVPPQGNVHLIVDVTGYFE